MTNSDRPVLDDLWRAYEAAHKHYDNDHQLFATRMNLFLVVESALLAGAIASATSGRPLPGEIRIPISIFGALLSLTWLTVALVSYSWIKLWRRRAVNLAKQWQSLSSIELAISAFEGDGSQLHSIERIGRLWWAVRPTFVICTLPALFLVSWLYLGIFVR